MSNAFMDQINGPDLLTMINIDEFGVTAIYTPKNSAPVEIPVLFQAEEREVDVGLEVPAISHSPSVHVRKIDITWEIRPNRDTISVEGKLFDIVDFVDDEQGVIELILQEAS